MISIEIAKYFQGGTILAVTALRIAAFQSWQNRDARHMLQGNNSQLGLIVIALTAYCLIIGNRPLSGVLFGDTANYAMTYGWVKLEDVRIGIGEYEWLFAFITALCAKYVDVSVYFTVIMFGYMFFALGGLRRLFGNNTYGA